MGVSASAFDCCNGNADEQTVFRHSKGLTRHPSRKIELSRVSYENRRTPQMENQPPLVAEWTEFVRLANENKLDSRQFFNNSEQRIAGDISYRLDDPDGNTTSFNPHDNYEEFQEQPSLPTPVSYDDFGPEGGPETSLRKHSPWVEQYLSSRAATVINLDLLTGVQFPRCMLTRAR
jgi:hypothetical protein